jgi:hypothetical protein
MFYTLIVCSWLDRNVKRVAATDVLQAHKLRVQVIVSPCITAAGHDHIIYSTNFYGFYLADVALLPQALNLLPFHYCHHIAYTALIDFIYVVSLLKRSNLSNITQLWIIHTVIMSNLYIMFRFKVLSS